MAKRRVDEIVSFKLRLPEGLRQQLEAEAEKAERSINSEILWRLGQTFGEKWQAFIAGVEAREKAEEEIRQELVERLVKTPEVMKIISEMVPQRGPKGSR